MSLAQRDPGGAAVPGSLAVLACAVLAACGSADRGGTAAPPSADPGETTYTVTCDGIVPEGLRATFVGGVARIPADASRWPYYEHYDLRIAATRSGDVDGDGAPDTVVLLECSPQPSNGVVQEVQAYSSAGRLLGGLPSPRTLREALELPPVYDPAGLSVSDGEIVAAMAAYAPGDSRASGPSVPLTVRWRYDGSHFVRVPTS